MKLYYFDAAGRAEPIRIMLKTSGTGFEDVRFSHGEWASTYKALSPTGQVPFLELDDGSKMCQSMAISMYVAGKTGYLPADALDQCRTIEVLACIEDCIGPLMPTFSMPDGDEKLNARKAMIAPGGAMHQKISVLDKMLAASKFDYYLCDKPTLVDIYIYNSACQWTSGFLDGIKKEDVSQFKNVWALRDKVANWGPVKEMYANADNQQSYKP